MTAINDMELAYVRLACEGLSCEQIAKRIFRSVHTVYCYREEVRRKTGSRNMIEAIAKLYDAGILQPKSSYETIRTRSSCPQAMREDAGPVGK